MQYKVNLSKLQEVVDKTVEIIRQGRDEVYEISESVKKECRNLENELRWLKEEVTKLIAIVESLEIHLAKSKQKLAEISKNFDKHSEYELKLAYEVADKIRMELVSKREQEIQLRKRRDELEVKLKDSYKTAEKAESLMSNLTVALGYITLDLNDITLQIEDMRQRQMLGLKIIKAQEDERHRVAREIHDGPAQLMSNVVLKAELCERLIDIDIDKAREELKDLKKVIRESLQEVRKIIYGLRPMSIDDLGLVPTLNKYIENYVEETGIKVSFKVKGDNPNLNKGIAVTVFRVLQEALNNIKKHAEARNVLINMEFFKDRLEVLISDNGKGFNIEEVNTEKDGVNGGFGLISMRERIELINGKFNIDSILGNGTNIIIEIPIQPGEVNESE